MAQQERIIVSQLPEPDLPENAAMKPHGSHVENEPALVEGVSRDRLPAGTDRLSVMDERRAALKINDEKEICVWKLNPEIHKSPENSLLDLENWLAVTGGRVVYRDMGAGKKDFVRNGDLVLCTMPRKMQEEFEARQKQEQAKFLDDVQDGDIRNPHDDDGGVFPRYRERSRDEMQKWAEAEHEASIDAGFVGEFAGMPFQQVLSMLGKDAWQEMEQSHRGGPKITEELTEERAQEKAGRGRNSGGKFISIPDGVKPKNLMRR